MSDYFLHKKYQDALDYLQQNNIPQKDFYRYFAYNALHDIEKCNNLFLKFEKKYNKDYGKLYYDMAIVCQNISTSYYGYPTTDDVVCYLDYALSTNPAHPEALFAKGKVILNGRNTAQRNIIEGINLINEAVKYKPDLFNKKEDIIRNVYAFSYTPDFRLFVSPRELDLIYDEYSKCNIGDDTEKLLKLLEFDILLGNEGKSKRIIAVLENKKLDSYQEYHINVLYCYLYLKKQNLHQALVFAEKLGFEWTSICYQRFSKYKEAADFLYKQYEDQKQKKRGGKINILLEVSRLYLKAKKYSHSLKLVTKYIDEELDMPDIYPEFHIESEFIRGTALYKLKQYDEAIDSLKQAYYLAQNVENPKQVVKSLLEEVLFQLALVYVKKHENHLIKTRLRYPFVLEELSDVIKCKDLIGNLSDTIYLNTTTINTAKRYFKELLGRNAQWEKRIKAIESKIKEREKKEQKIKAQAIVGIAQKALIYEPEDIEVLFKLAFHHNRLGNYSESITAYQKLLTLEPNNLTFRNNLAWAYDENGQVDEAGKLFDNILYSNKLDSSSLADSLLKFYNKETNECKENHYEMSKEKVMSLYNSVLKKQIADESHSASRPELDSNITHLNAKILYKYRNFNLNTIDSIINSYFYFNALDKLNDPLDIPIIEMKGIKELEHCGIERDDFKIFCLSLERENHLMWSHYADSHKGICIGYLINYLPKSIGWGEVNYFSKNSDFYRMAQYNDAGLIHAGLYSKNELWEYEKEVRLVSVNLNKNENKVNYHEEPIPIHLLQEECIHAYISEIILGIHFPDEHLPLIKSVVKNLNMKYKKIGPSAIKILKATRVPDYPFKLKIIKN